jgi:hypothetical protein
MKAQHTEGDWKVVKCPQTGHLWIEVRRDCYKSAIAQITPGLLAEKHGGSAEANAQLMASAPRLLAALESFSRAADWLRANPDSPKSALTHFLMAAEYARGIISESQGVPHV